MICKSRTLDKSVATALMALIVATNLCRPASAQEIAANAISDRPDEATPDAANSGIVGGQKAIWSLQQLIDLAARNNPTIHAGSEQEIAAQQEISSARWQFFPTPQVQFEGDRHDHLIVSTVSQALYTFGRLSAGLAAARAQAVVAGERTAEARYNISLRVLDAYGQFASYTRQITVWDGDIARHRDLEGMIARRVESGLSAPVDLNFVQTRLSQARIARDQLRARRRSVLAALSQLVGVALDDNALQLPAEQAALEASVADRISVAELVSRSLEMNPTLRRTEAEIAVAREEEKSARVAMLPSVVARFENRTYTRGYPSNGMADTRLTVGVQLSTGSGFSSLAGIAMASAKTRAVGFSRDAAKLDITSNVIAARESYLAARSSVQGLRSSVSVQEQTSESYNRMFLAGKRSWLDVLNMVREQTSISRDLADAEVQLFVADYRLRIETGDQ